MENETKTSTMSIPIEIAFADEETQAVVSVTVPPTYCVEAAIQHSGILTRLPDIDLTKNKVGIFGKICQLSTLLQPGDRIEIYRALRVDPKKNRKHRAKK